MSGEQTPQENGSWLQRHKLQIAAVAAGLVALVAPELGHNIFDGTPKHQGITAALPNARPNLMQEPDYDEVYVEAGAEFNYDGYASTVTVPTASDETFFFDNYLENSGSLPYSNAPLPRLREVAYIIDSQTYPQDLNDRWGFAVYNASDEPIDLPFIRYTTEFLKKWVEHNRQIHISIPANMTAEVSPEETSHNVMLVDVLPPSPIDNSIDGSFTYDYTNSTFSWVEFGSHPSPEVARHLENVFERDNYQYEKYSALSIELCQAMLNVFHARSLIGGGGADYALKHYLHDNLTDTAQEIVCNSLGAALAAYYLSGDEGLSEAILKDNSSLGLQRTPLLDYNLATSMIGTMAAIKERVQANPGSLYMVAGSQTPTAQADK